MKGAYSEGLLPGWPSDAPLQLRPRVGETRIDQAEAEKRARQWEGMDPTQSVQMWRAYLTDNDFPFLSPRDLPVWVAEVRDLVIPPPEGQAAAESGLKAVKIPHLYLALDAESGLCVEAFTPPKRSWWLEYPDLVGPPHENSFREDGRVFERPWNPPLLSIREALQKAIPREEAAAQIVMRYVLYSNYHQGIGVERVEGHSLIPRALRRPAWVVIHEGVHLHPSGPGPTEYVGRALDVLDAETGEFLEQGSYGSPLGEK